jgi:hypothetical protein
MVNNLASYRPTSTHPRSYIPYLPATTLISLLKYEHRLRQRQLRRRLSRAMHAIRLDPIILRIDMNLRHLIIMLHILLPDRPAPLHSLHALLQTIRLDVTAVNRRLGNKEHRCGRNVGREHRTPDNGLHGRDGRVGVALVMVSKEGAMKGGMTWLHLPS